jgi:hypothetical protein
MPKGMLSVLAVAAGMTMSMSAACGALQDAAVPITARDKAPNMIARAITYLRSQQDQKSGGWCIQEGAPVFPAITGLVLQGMLAQPGITQDDPSVQEGVKFILDHQQQDGGFYVGLLPSYNTAICLTALKDVTSPVQAADAKARALDFLRTLQFGEGAVVHEGMGDSARPVDKDHAYYGGFGYGRSGRPDMSNTSFAVEAMHAMNLPDNDPAFQRAVAFLQRCQMLEKGADGSPVNDMAYAQGSTQGGFIYATSPNKDSIGAGISYAGEIAESLDGRGGASARVTLQQVDGKFKAMTKGEVAAKIKVVWDREPDTSRGIIPQEFLVLLGAGDGGTSSRFEVRATVSPARLTEILSEALRDDIAGPASIAAQREEHWHGQVRHRAYGTMTYAGLKSYLYAGLSKDDPRVLAAREWISRNYSLSVNPGVDDTDGLYYSYLMFARTYDALGEQVVPVQRADGTTEQRDWAKDLVDQLATLQNEDGSFRSVDDRWMEDNPVLITAYSLIALQCAAR